MRSKDHRRKHIRTVIRFGLVLLLSVVFWNEPPTHTMAETPLNKQTVQEAMTQPVSVVEQPQPPAAPQELPKPVVHPSNCEAYRHLVEKYQWNVNIALNVMRAESGCNPYAVGDKHIPPVSCGLFQIRTLAGRPSCEALKDPATNVAWAYRLYRDSGWKPWSVCKTKVRCY